MKFSSSKVTHCKVITDIITEFLYFHREIGLSTSLLGYVYKLISEK